MLLDCLFDYPRAREQPGMSGEEILIHCLALQATPSVHTLSGEV